MFRLKKNLKVISSAYDYNTKCSLSKPFFGFGGFVFSCFCFGGLSLEKGVGRGGGGGGAGILP